MIAPDLPLGMHRIGHDALVDKNTRLRTERVAETLVGLSESEATATAEAAGITVRVARRDGKRFMSHKDLRPSRVSLIIDRGRVTAVQVG
jgi:hypothetical protein